MRSVWQRVAAALLVVVLCVLAWLGVEASRRPPLTPFMALTMAEAQTAAPGQLRVRFAGVATLLFDDGETAWMTDGFFSRPSKLRTLISKIEPDPAAIDRGLSKLGVTRLAAVVPVHSHYDHAMDAPVVAMRTGALLVGSRSTMNIGRGLGMPADRLREVKPGDTLQLGKFKLTFLASRHSPTPLTDGTDGAGKDTIDAPLVPPARATDWREGEVWSLLVEHNGRRLLVQGSAGFVPGALYGVQADTVFLGVGTLGRKDEAYRNAYWQQVVKAVGARRVVPIHWDDFWLPLTQPLQTMPLLIDNFSVTMGDLAARSTRESVELRMPPLFLPFDPLLP